LDWLVDTGPGCSAGNVPNHGAMPYRPGPTEGNRRYNRIELIAIWCSIGSALVGVFVTGQILHLIGFN
jgi:hypothetical protein